MEHRTVTMQEIIESRTRIRPYIRHTPLEKNRELSDRYEANIYLKLENLQVTGSFKARGSIEMLLRLGKTERERGVIAPSAGNHGIGLAYAASLFNVPAFVYLPIDADPSKVKALESYGADITFFDSIEEARLTALHDAKEKGSTFVSAYNNHAMIRAGGTIGLEILEDLQNVDTVISGLGGGGLTAGLCLALKSANPNIKIWGVQAKNSPTFAVWHQNGKVMPVHLQPSIADGMSGPIEPETITFPIIHELIDGIITVTEEEIVEAMKTMLDSQYIVEPTGAAGIAALKQLGGELRGRNAAVLVTGRNISWSRFVSLVQ